jgi:general secretion pathway protein G
MNTSIKNKRFSSTENGFTLMEMIVVLVIIGLLISCGISFYDGYIENAKIVKAKSQISVMQSGMDCWYAEHGCYPQSAEEQMLAGLDLEVEDP